MRGLMGKKLGMTQVFSEKGERVPVTVISAGPCIIIGKRTDEKDGYKALQLGFGAVAAQRLGKPVKGLFEKNSLSPLRHVREVRVEDPEAYQVGQTLDVEIFKVGERVDVIGTSKGKGFAGAMKRWNFNGGPASHGSMTHRQPASGGSTDAAKVIKGKRGPGRLGGVRCTVQGLEVLRVDKERNLLLVRGAVPGAANSLVFIRESVKK